MLRKCNVRKILFTAGYLDTIDCSAGSLFQVLSISRLLAKSLLLKPEKEWGNSKLQSIGWA